MKSTYLSIVLCLIISVALLAQNTELRSGKFGVGYSGNFTTQSNQLGFTVWASNNLVVEPQIGFRHINVEDNKGTAFKLGLGFLGYFNEFIISPYMGGRIQAAILDGGGKTYTDMVYSLVFGGEYFVSEWFSMGAELRLNYVSTDKEFSPMYDVANADIFESEQVVNIKLYFN